MTDLNTLVTLPPGAFITQAVAINDSGQIVANGYLNNQGQFKQAFLLNPVPEPSAAMLAGLAAIGALGLARRLRRAGLSALFARTRQYGGRVAVRRKRAIYISPGPSAMGYHALIGGANADQTDSIALQESLRNRGQRPFL